MQQVATEVRLLGIMLRQHEANAKYEPPPVPFLVTPTPQAASASYAGQPTLARPMLLHPSGRWERR